MIALEKWNKQGIIYGMVLKALHFYKALIWTELKSVVMHLGSKL